MKKFTTLILLSLLFGTYIYAQAPETFKYQAVVRDALGEIVASDQVDVKIGILANAADGNLVYEETHSDSTNAYGLLSLHVGQGTVVSGDFSAIDWGGGTYFLRVAIDLGGQGNYKTMGTSQLLSVPYANYATQAGNVFSGNYYDLANTPNMNQYIKNVETATWDKDTTNELQTLSIDNKYELSISKKGFTVHLPDSVYFATYADNPGDKFEVSYSQVLDKPQLSLVGDTIFLTHGGHVNLPDTIAWANAPTDAFDLPYSQLSGDPDQDMDATNEYQNLSISNDTIMLENSDMVVLPDTIQFAMYADSIPYLQDRIDSLEAVIDSRVGQSVVDSLENRLNAQANTNWLSQTEGFYIDSRDKKRYEFKLIGEQVWLTENLNSGTYIDGSVEDAANDIIEKYAYNNAEANLDTLGGLYTWREMMQLPDSCATSDCADLIEDQHQGVCPDGWHIPGPAEWQTLIDNYGGLADASDDLKSTDALWKATNVANNNSGFSALPGGEKQGGSAFVDKRTKAYFGVSSQNDAVNMNLIRLENDNTTVYEPVESKTHAVSVRCIQDD